MDTAEAPSPRAPGGMRCRAWGVRLSISAKTGSRTARDSRGAPGGRAPGRHGSGQTPNAAGYRMVPAGTGRVSSRAIAIMASSGTSNGARMPKREAGVKPNRG